MREVVNFGCYHHAVEIDDFWNSQSFVVLPSHWRSYWKCFLLYSVLYVHIDSGVMEFDFDISMLPNNNYRDLIMRNLN